MNDELKAVCGVFAQACADGEIDMQLIMRNPAYAQRALQVLSALMEEAMACMPDWRRKALGSKSFEKADAIHRLHGLVGPDMFDQMAATYALVVMASSQASAPSNRPPFLPYK